MTISAVTSNHARAMPATREYRHGARSPLAARYERLMTTCNVHDVAAGHLYLVDAEGLRLCASQGTEAPNAALTAAAQALLENEQGRAVSMDDMATGELLDDAVSPDTVVLEGTAYDLRLLKCLVDDVSTLMSVITFETSSLPPPTGGQIQLLHALALYLVRAGDSAGVQLSS